MLAPSDLDDRRSSQLVLTPTLPATRYYCVTLQLIEILYAKSFTHFAGWRGGDIYDFEALQANDNRHHIVGNSARPAIFLAGLVGIRQSNRHDNRRNRDSLAEYLALDGLWRKEWHPISFR